MALSRVWILTEISADVLLDALDLHSNLRSLTSPNHSFQLAMISSLNSWSRKDGNIHGSGCMYRQSHLDPGYRFVKKFSITSKDGPEIHQSEYHEHRNDMKSVLNRIMCFGGGNSMPSMYLQEPSTMICPLKVRRYAPSTFDCGGKKYTPLAYPAKTTA